MSFDSTSQIPLPPRPGMIDRFAKSLVTGRLASLRRGRIRLQDATGNSLLGEDSDLEVTLQVHHPGFYRETVLGGTLSVAESYIRGDWDCDDLTNLIRIFVRNLDHADQFDGGLARLQGTPRRRAATTSTRPADRVGDRSPRPLPREDARAPLPHLHRDDRQRPPALPAVRRRAQAARRAAQATAAAEGDALEPARAGGLERRAHAGLGRPLDGAQLARARQAG